MRTGELFLSHATPDRAFVARLTKRLAARKIQYFYSKRHIAGARQWHDELGVALERCSWFVLILSKKSVKSQWVKRELLFALQARRYRERIVPVLLQDCAFAKLSWTLPSFQLVDFRTKFDAGFVALLKALRGSARVGRGTPAGRRGARGRRRRRGRGRGR